jgi:hypothetical protein
MWVNLPTESRMAIEEKLPQRVDQTIRATKSILTVFLNSKEFALVNLLPHGAPFTAAHFVDNVIIQLPSQRAQQRGDIARRILHLHFDNSKCCTARHVEEEIASHRCLRISRALYSFDLSMADFHLFGRLEQQFSGRIMDREQNVPEIVIEVISGLP